ncbi:MAG: tyrosine-type recombinase/integrase [Candidatus Dormibacteria bacterium]
MPRARKYDGVVYRRASTQIWWIRYRDRNGVARRESSQTADWQEANRKLRERLQARDDNLLEVVRKGETLTFGQWADQFMENYSKPPVRAVKTHEANQRCMKHLKAAFGTSRLVDITADSIELYLRDRLRQHVRVKAKLGYRQLGAVKATTVHQEFRVLRCMLNVAVRKKLLRSNPCSGAEFPVAVRGLFRPHYVTWSEQQQIESRSPQYLRNVIRIITETGLRVYKELTPMRKDQVDLLNAFVWIPDSKTPNGVAEVPLSPLAIEAFKSQMAISGNGPFLFPSGRYSGQHQTTLKTVWRKSLRRAEVTYFRIYDLRSTYATRLSAGGVADEWVTQMLRQSDAQVFKKYSQMKLQMKREALEKLNRRANEMAPVPPPNALMSAPMCTVVPQ